MVFKSILMGAAASVTAASASATPLMTRHVPQAADTAHYAGRAPATQLMHLTIALPLHHEAELDQFLADLQNPKTPSYRHYLSGTEFRDRFGPTEQEFGTLRNFAQQHGLTITHEAPNRLLMAVSAPVAAVEQAFGVHIGFYRHPDGTRYFFAPDREPSMNTPVQVLHINGLDNFALPKSMGVRSGTALPTSIQSNGSGPNGSLTGTDIRTAYYGTSKALTGVSQIVALVEFAGWNPTDIANYFANLGQTSTVPVTGISVDGTSLSCTAPACDDFEQALDIEQAVSVAPGLKQLSVYVGSDETLILNKIATDNKAKQISNSWAWPHNAADDTILKQFAAQGQSFFAASGDSGATLTSGVWPADSDYATAVGGTMLFTTSPGGTWVAESAWSNSGGGITPDKVLIPSWQVASINAQNGGAKKFRNVPDVAAEANYDSFACYDGGCSGNNGGTSFAAPRWAAFTALINEQAAISKKGKVGLLNASLYALSAGAAYGTAMHDITAGANNKYKAVPGYDLVTGLGSPQIGLISALLGP